MKIWVYTIVYNEAHFVKNFLKAYSDAEKIIVYDNMSTDDTVKLLREDPRVEIRIHDSGGEIRDDLYLQVKNNCWKEARGKADWVIICDFDEIFTQCIGKSFTNLKLNLDYDIIKPYGYMIYAEDMPGFQDYNPLMLPLKGIYDTNSEKLCCFRPDKILEINYNPGCHTANPVPMKNSLRSLNIPAFKLVHFKYINILLYFNRLKQYKQRMSKYNLETGFGVHYTWPFEVHRDNYINGILESKPLFEITKP